MDRHRNDFYWLWCHIGIMIIVAGGVLLKALPTDKEMIAVIVILAGILVGIIMNIVLLFVTDKLYVCPECKAQFKLPENEVTLTANRRYMAILTCPECKKTNLCIRKLVSKSGKYGEAKNSRKDR